MSIRDEGPGLRDNEAEALFEPFVRGRHPATSGVGLGLFIVRSFLEAMGGSIRARPRPDGRSGLAFEITLPAAAAAEAAA
jgi:two-component system sensor histidine kinase KdpD